MALDWFQHTPPLWKFDTPVEVKIHPVDTPVGVKIHPADPSPLPVFIQYTTFNFPVVPPSVWQWRGRHSRILDISRDIYYPQMDNLCCCQANNLKST